MFLDIFDCQISVDRPPRVISKTIEYTGICCFYRLRKRMMLIFIVLTGILIMTILS